jgi:hypothetical protein
MAASPREHQQSFAVCMRSGGMSPLRWDAAVMMLRQRRVRRSSWR